MTKGRTQDISLAEARSLIRRAIDKAEQLGLSGGIAVVGGSGALVSASRMDHGGAGGMTRARSKAWIAATQQIPSTVHLDRMNTIAPATARGFTVASPEALFPGAGGMPIRRDGKVIAGIAASGASVSPFFPEGVDKEAMIADGKPANPEDLMIHYALGLPYAGQHGDDYAKWDRTFGPFPKDPPQGYGMAQAPAASRQPEHDWAISLADAVIKEATDRGVVVALAVTDHRGDPIQQDAMDGAATAAAFVSLALAATAATFQMPSDEVDSSFAPALPFTILCRPGGLPIMEDGRIVAGLGIAGVSTEACVDIARAALSRLA